MARNFSNADTCSTIAVLKRLFRQHGLLETLVSDNGSQFKSETFQHFGSSCCIILVQSPLYHPQSTGQAEHFVDTFQHARLKAKGERTTTAEILNIFLLSYRTTPNATVKKWKVSSRCTHRIKSPIMPTKTETKAKCINLTVLLSVVLTSTD